MKIGIYTTDLGPHVSGGILCIVEVLNKLIRMGHECVCFVDNPPYRSEWLKNDFDVLPSDKIKDYDGILVSPYSPTAKAVSKAHKAKDRFYWVHSNESLFCHNGEDWQKQARESYELPLKIFCVSSYLQILMETVFNRNVISWLVPPGVDTDVFYPVQPMQNGDKLVVGFLDRREWVRGTDITVNILHHLKNKSNGNIQMLPVPPHITDRRMMANYYRQMDVYLDLSRVAGSPTPVKEAMACGAIPICTRYGTTDFVLDGYNGYIVGQDNSGRICDILETLSYGVRESLSKNASQGVVGWSWDYIATNFEAAIEEGLQRTDLLTEKKWNIRR